jgi:hypothetical protein
MADIYGAWDTYLHQLQIIPVVAKGSPGPCDGGANCGVTYTTATTTQIGEDASAVNTALLGAPVHLTDLGPWVVTDLQPAALQNKSYVPPSGSSMCIKGPQFFGVEVTEATTGMKLYVETSFYKDVNFTNTSECSSQGCTLLTACTACTGGQICAPTTVATCPANSTFTKLGGVVDAADSSAPASGPMTVTFIQPIATTDYTVR